MDEPRNIVFAMTGATALTGGIATANRNVIAALVDLALEGTGRLDVLSYLESKADRPGRLPEWCEFAAFDGDRVAFARAVIGRSFGYSLMVFDHVSLALPVLPLMTMKLCRSAIFAHGSESWRRIRWTSRLTFRSTQLCLTNSRYTLHRMRAAKSLHRGVPCPLGLDPDIPLNASPLRSDLRPIVLQSSDGEPRPLGGRALLLVGRMDPQEREKGHRRLVKILPKIRSVHHDVQLVFAGPGEDRDYLRRMAVASGVGDAVFLPGRLPTEELQHLYQRSYAYVMPSRQEGFGLVYLEAMNWGKPCVGCRDDGAEDVIVHGETGYLVSGDDEELSDVVNGLLEDPELARRLGEAGLQRLHQRFTSDQHQARIKKALRPLL